MLPYEEKDIDYALEILAHPERELSKEFRTWMEDDTHRALYIELKAAHDGLALQEQTLPDVEEEWTRFMQDRNILPPPARNLVNNRHTSFWSIHKFQAAAVAAIIVLVGGIGFWLYTHQPQTSTIALMERNLQPQEVVLSNDQGGSIVLSGQTDKDSLASLGATLTGDKRLAYAPDDERKEAEASTQTLRTPRGKDFKVVLGDGTEVWLNAESTLTYPSRFTGPQRVVTLDGEAYFKVAHDAEHPFIVKTENIETQVLGTSFNFRHYAHATPHVTLVEGRVLVTGYDTSVTLTPNEDAQIHTDGTIRVSQVDTRNYTAWTEGYFYFDNASLEDIMRELGRWYNLSIQFENADAMNYHFTFWAKRTGSIEDALKLINGMGKVKTTLKDNTLTIH